MTEFLPQARTLLIMLALTAAPVLAVALGRRAGIAIPAALRRVGPALLVLLSLLVGYRLVWARLALFDDAYISLRYAQNLAEGHGLVWNLGEQVEGYTNFLWTVILAAFIKVTSIEAPLLAIVGSLLVFGGNLLAAASISRRLNGPNWLPLAVPLLALHPVFVAYGSTGMETGFCALLVLLQARALLEDGDRAVFLAGLAGIAAALSRPDHGLFYAVGSGVVGVEVLLRLRRDRDLVAGLKTVAAYSAPFLIYLAYMAWKVDYYGAVLPNTYWAKSADQAWWIQGRRYAWMFWIGTSAGIPALIAAVAAFWPGDRAQVRFGAFTLAAVVLYDVYVMKVGGDFMFGRFFVSLLPLVLLSSEALLGRLRHRPLAAALICGLLLASTQSDPLFEGTKERHGIVDENAYWAVEALRPAVRVGSQHTKLGLFLHRELVLRGMSPTIGSGGIGQLGFYSRLPIIDSRGLTDPVIAKQPLKKRTRPGHEKRAPRSYLIEREVRFLRLKGGQRRFHPKRFRELTKLSFRAAGIRDEWQIATYDRALMRRIAAEVPDMRFQDFEAWLDRYIDKLPATKPSQVKNDLPWLKAYYFDHSDDATRLAPIEARAR